MCYFSQRTNFGNEFIECLYVSMRKNERKAKEMGNEEARKKQQSSLLHMRMNSNCQEVESKTKCVQKHQ